MAMAMAMSNVFLKIKKKCCAVAFASKPYGLAAAAQNSVGLADLLSLSA